MIFPLLQQTIFYAKVSRWNIYAAKQHSKKFNQAASRYDEFADIQKITAKRLVQELQTLSLKPQKILDLGCGTGYLSDQIKQLYPDVDVVGVDLSDAMLKRHSHQHHKICADAQQLPFAEQSFDLIVSNAMLQWLPDLIIG